MNCVHSPKLGSITRAVHYLFGPADSQQRKRERVELLRGDAQQLIDLVNTLPSPESACSGSAYDSIVLSFSPLDQPSRKQIQEVIARLPAALFPGGRDRVCWLAKLHADGTSVHVHVLVARVDLVTGLQFSVTGMGLRPVRELCRAMNRRHGWADPQDEFRGRLAWWKRDITGPGLPFGKGIHEHARALAIAGVLEGRVDSQADMVRVLRPVGQVIRMGRHSITLDVTAISLQGSPTPSMVKFSGLLYAQAFDRAAVLRALAPAPLPAALTKRDTPLEDEHIAKALFARMLLNAQKRAEALAARYAVTRARARRSLMTRIAWECGQEAPIPKTDLRQRQPTSRGTLNLALTHIPGALHETTSSPDHRVHADGHRPVSAGTGSVVDRSASAENFAELGRAMLESARAWVRDALAPRVLEVVRRAVGAILENVIGAEDLQGRHGRPNSALGAHIDSVDRSAHTASGNPGQGGLGTGRSSGMNQDAKGGADAKDASSKASEKGVRLRP